MSRGLHPKDDVQRTHLHHEVHSFLKAQNLEATKGKIFQEAKENPLERASQHNFRMARAKGGVRRVARDTTRGAMTITEAVFAAVFNPPVSL